MISIEEYWKSYSRRQVTLFCLQKGLGTNSILCYFCRCWVHKRYGANRANLKEESKFVCQANANQQIDTAKDCPGRELNRLSLEFAEKKFLGATTGAVGGTIHSVIARNKFRDLVSLLTSRGLLLGAKCRLYSAYIFSVILYGNQRR